MFRDQKQKKCYGKCLTDEGPVSRHPVQFQPQLLNILFLGRCVYKPNTHTRGVNAKEK